MNRGVFWPIFHPKSTLETKFQNQEKTEYLRKADDHAASVVSQANSPEIQKTRTLNKTLKNLY